MSEETRMITINLTQHKATSEQIEAGVLDLPLEMQEELKTLLTFEYLPSVEDIERIARMVSRLALRVLVLQLENSESPVVQAAIILQESGVKTAIGQVGYYFQFMIGGAPFLMAPLENALKSVFLKPVYAFSARESVDTIIDDKVVKTSVFKHLGFVEA